MMTQSVDSGYQDINIRGRGDNADDIGKNRIITKRFDVESDNVKVVR